MWRNCRGGFNDLNDPTGLALPTRPIEEADERVVAVALHATADYCALKHVGRGKQRARAMGRL